MPVGKKYKGKPGKTYTQRFTYGGKRALSDDWSSGKRVDQGPSQKSNDSKKASPDDFTVKRERQVIQGTPKEAVNRTNKSDFTSRDDEYAKSLRSRKKNEYGRIPMRPYLPYKKRKYRDI